MKKIKSIIAFLLCLCLLPLPAQAAELTAPETACQDLKPNYETIRKEWTDAELKNAKAYTANFEMVQTAYHSYVGCMFNYAEEEILQRNNKAMDWLAPKKACVDPDKAKDVIFKTNPTQMLGPILQAHTDYKNYLAELGKNYSDKGVETDENDQQLIQTRQLLAKAAFFSTAERKRQMEVDTSMVAIDMMFTSLKELRLAFVMHVHFQCTLKYLEKYRKALGELRKLIMPLPDQLRDASIN